MRRAKFKGYDGKDVEGWFHCFDGAQAIIEKDDGRLVYCSILQLQFIDKPKRDDE